jgi:hypothetical protein
MTTIVRPADVAVVVQGPIAPLTGPLLAAIRLHLPGARTVLSTWDGAAVDQLDADEIVLSADPGTLACTTLNGVPGLPINTTRMVTSTLAGLRHAERSFVLKLRSDAVLDHGGVLQLMAELPLVTGEWALFERMIGVSSVYTRNPFKTPTGSFHPADTVQYGTVDDLLVLWDVPPMPADDAHYFDDPTTRPVWSGTSQRYYPEQWIFISALRKRHEVNFEHRAVFSAEVMRDSNRALAQNFVVAEPWQMGVHVPHLDANLRWGEDPVCVMTHPIWHRLRAEALLPPPTAA